MGTKRVSLADLGRVLQQDLRTLHRRTLRATWQAAAAGRDVARSKAPEGLGGVREGILAEPLPDGARIRSSAPHSGIVEHGSRPHWPPLEPLIAWVRKRGAEGLEAGPEATGYPAAVARKIGRMERDGAVRADAPTRIARRIAASIARNGTRPRPFMASTVPEVEQLFHALLQEAFAEDL